jgi:hypothetical protein
MELSKTLISKIKNLCTYNGLGYDLIDWMAEVDRTLTESENINLLKQKFHLKTPDDYNPEEVAQITKYKSWHEIREDGLNIFDYELPKTIVVYGERGTGKTALGHVISDKIRQCRGLPVFVYKSPRPDLMQRIGYRNINNLADIKKLNNCILWLDEPQTSLPKYEGRNNDILIQIISISRHNQITTLITTSDSRWVTKHLESYIDLWIIKDCDMQLIKNGSKIKNIVREYETFSPESFELQNNEYLLYMRKNKDFRGKYTFQKPKYYTEEYSTTYKNHD